MRLLGLTVLAVLALCVPAQAKVGCGDGVRLFAEGRLQMFAVPWRSQDEWGADHYACWQGRRPVAVGADYSNTGTGSDHTLTYAHAGRFLASYHQSDGEGGPSAHVSVVDLVRRRSVSFANVACCEWTPALRLASDGTLAVLSPGEGLFVKAPGRRSRTLADEGAARDLAMFGGTVYWTEDGKARSARLPGVRGGEAHALEPVRVRRRGGACAAAGGRTIAASGSVRVVERVARDGSARRFACRIGGQGRFAAGFTDEPAPRIVADRWVLARGERSARVVDSRSGEEVTTAGGEIAAATLLRDGTLAWLEEGGRLLAQRPGSPAFVLAATGASELAAARRAVYWTRDGVPERYPVAR